MSLPASTSSYALTNPTLLSGPLSTSSETENHDYCTCEEEDSSGDEEYFSAEDEDSSWDEEEESDDEEEEIFEQESDFSEEGRSLSTTPVHSLIRDTLVKATVDSCDPIDEIHPCIEAPFGGSYKPSQRMVGGPDPEKKNGPTSPTASRVVASGDFPPHSCNCPYCPPNNGFISKQVQPPPSLVERSFDAGNFHSARAGKSTLTSNAPTSPAPNHEWNDATLPPFWGSEERDRRKVDPGTFTLPSLRSLDIWHDPQTRTPTIPAVSTSTHKMSLSFILNLAPATASSNLLRSQSKVSASSKTSSINVGPLTSVLKEVSFTPDFSSDLKAYSSRWTQNVRTAHPSRDPQNLLHLPPFPGPLRVPSSPRRVH